LKGTVDVRQGSRPDFIPHPVAPDS
jgi:hypothetical protein